MTSSLTVISWRDIPAQVVATRGRVKERVELPSRFQVAIDRAAMEAGLVGTDDYLEAWKRTTRQCGEDLAKEAADEAARIDSVYDRDRLNRLIQTFGNDEEAT